MTATGETTSFATAATIVSGTTVFGTSTVGTADKITGMGVGDIISLAGIAGVGTTYTGAAGTTIASAASTTVALVIGSYSSGNVWTTTATGSDILFVYDADAATGGTVVEAIVLVGSAATVTGGTVVAGVLTLS